MDDFGFVCEWYDGAQAAPAGFCELQVLKTSATATAGNHFSLPQPTSAVSQVGSSIASKCFEGAAPYAISSCASG
jgi:hypothetical protein